MNLYSMLLMSTMIGLPVPWDLVTHQPGNRERAPSMIERVDRNLPRVALPPERKSKRARRRARGKEGRRG